MNERNLLTGSVEVLTFKEGVLSRIAHDLCLRVGEFEVAVLGDAVEGSFVLNSLRVAHALRDGTPDPNALSAGDRSRIEENVRDKVLRTDRNPKGRFSGKIEGSVPRQRIVGRLSLNGQEHPLEVHFEHAEGRAQGHVEFQPSRWGIAPFKAMLGAIKLEDRVRVRFDLLSSVDQ